MSLAAVCRSFGVDGLPRRRVRKASNNEHWYLGEDFVLERSNPLRRDAQLAFQHAVLGHLARAGWPVPAPIAAADGETVLRQDDHRYSLFPRLPGRRRPARPPRDPQALGALLGRLHTTMLESTEKAPGWADGYPPVLAVVVDPLWEQLDVVRDRRLRARTRAQLDGLADDLRSVDFTAAVSGLVHGDWSESQLLYQDGAVSGILDFEFVHPDLLATDLAAVTSGTDLDTSVQFVRGYESERELADAEVAVIGLAQRGRRLQFCWPAVHSLLRGGDAGAEHLRLQLDQLEEEQARWPRLEAALRR